jgi:hypothetical protein
VLMARVAVTEMHTDRNVDGNAVDQGRRFRAGSGCACRPSGQASRPRARSARTRSPTGSPSRPAGSSRAVGKFSLHPSLDRRRITGQAAGCANE